MIFLIPKTLIPDHLVIFVVFAPQRQIHIIAQESRYAFNQLNDATGLALCDSLLILATS
jgi:hypothetical protein